MSGTYTFGLVVSGPMSDDVIDAIYAVAPESTVSIDRDGTGGLIEFDEESENVVAIQERMQEAVDAIESVGLRVERIEPDELVYAADIANRCGRSRSSIDHLIRGVRGPGNFPRPFTHAGTRNPMWRWTEVKGWLDEYTGQRDEDALLFARIVAYLNARLEMRRSALGGVGHPFFKPELADSMLGSFPSVTHARATIEALDEPVAKRRS